MEFEIAGTFHFIAEEIVHMTHHLVHGDEPLKTKGEYLKRWRKKDKSHVTGLDVEIEKRVLEIVRHKFPGMPILAEEQNPNMPESDLFVSLDPVDGTSRLIAGRSEWGPSLAIVAKGEPIAGFVNQPVLGLAFAGMKTGGVQSYDYEKAAWFDLDMRNRPRHPLFGADLGLNSPEEYWDEVRRYAEKTNMSFTNLPAVATGIAVLLGQIDSAWSYTFHHWDMAALAVLLEEIGGVIECLDGSPIPWTSNTKLPPMLIAASREIAERMRILIASPVEEPPAAHFQQLRHGGRKSISHLQE